MIDLGQCGYMEASGVAVGDGGPASQACVSGPAGLATDAAGDLYIAEALGNRVRRIDRNGTITTVAGNAAGVPGFAGDGQMATLASLYHPAGVAVDGAGHLFIAGAASG